MTDLDFLVDSPVVQIAGEEVASYPGDKDGNSELVHVEEHFFLSEDVFTSKGFLWRSYLLLWEEPRAIFILRMLSDLGVRTSYGS